MFANFDFNMKTQNLAPEESYMIEIGSAMQVEWS